MLYSYSMYYSLDECIAYIITIHEITTYTNYYALIWKQIGFENSFQVFQIQAYENPPIKLALKQ